MSRCLRKIFSLLLAVLLVIGAAPVTFAAGDVCAIGASNYASLDDALATVGNNATATIELLQDIEYTDNVYFDGGQNIIFDLSGHTLDITAGSGDALTVMNGAVVDITGGGALNVTSLDGRGVRVDGIGSKATVTNATASGGYNCGGAYAVRFGAVTIQGNTTGSGDSTFGAYAADGGTVIVRGNVTGSGKGSVGVKAEAHGEITVQGSVMASGTNSVGAQVERNSEITVDGVVSGARYIGFKDMGTLNQIIKTKANFEVSTTKAGYRTYAHTDSNGVSGTSTVWVWDDGTGNDGFNTVIEVLTSVELDAAISGMSDGDEFIIKLLQNISHNKAIYLDGGKTITFDLNGHTLDITSVSGNALYVDGGAVVDITGAGVLNVTSLDGVGVLVNGAGSGATVTNATGNRPANSIYYCSGAYASHGGTIIVKGNATATGYESCGASADNGTVTIHGNATASGHESCGTEVEFCGEITIGGTVRGENYMRFYDYGLYDFIIKSQTDFSIPTTKAGYYTYAHTDSDGVSGTSNVWVKIPSGNNTNHDSDSDSNSGGSSRDTGTDLPRYENCGHAEWLVK